MSEKITEKEALRREAANLRAIVTALMTPPEPVKTPAGIRVIDRKSEVHEYPNATSAEVGDDTTLTVWQRTEDDQRPVAIFYSWDHVERINPLP